jgi:1-acyl-sn-glycerol-3-phosphate acyltransferase
MRRTFLEETAATAIIEAARLATGARPLWKGCAPEPRQRIYFANHTSHIDFVLLWASLPRHIRRDTRPIAGEDYWYASKARRWIVDRVFRAVAIPRAGDPRQAIARIQAALDEGSSLIVFPEGTRNMTDQKLLPLRNGLFWLAHMRREVECVPVWIANLNRVLPKGEFLPIPLLCTVTFGAPIALRAEETREDFLARAREGLLSLAPRHLGSGTGAVTESAP